MTREEQRLADEQARTAEQLAELKRRQKDLEVRKAKLEQQRRQARYLSVGKLVEQVGLLWADDAHLLEALQWGRERLEQFPPEKGEVPAVETGRTLPPIAPR